MQYFLRETTKERNHPGDWEISSYPMSVGLDSLSESLVVLSEGIYVVVLMNIWLLRVSTATCCVENPAYEHLSSTLIHPTYYEVYTITTISNELINLIYIKNNKE